MNGPRRILLAQTSFLGDVVLTTALARILREAIDGAEIWWLVRPDAVDLVAPLAGRERVLAFDKRGTARGWRGVYAMAQRLRRSRFDAAIGVQRSLRTAALLALARIPLRVGFRGSLGAPLYHRTVPHAGVHARDRLARLATGLGVVLPAQLPDPELVVDPSAARAIGARLAAAGLGAGERPIVLAPGSVWATKRWPAAHFASAAADLASTAGDALAIVGAPADRPLAREIAVVLESRRPPLRVLDWTGTTSIAELVALLDRAALVLANDSAPAHIAAALGRPVVAVFGPTVPAQGFAPLGPRASVVGRDLACRPCSRHGGDRCPIGTHECMVALEPRAVTDAARKLFGASAEDVANRSAGDERQS